MSKMILNLNLYWATTKLEPEDWFIVAPSKEIACDCHECSEGFNEGNASAEFICEIPLDLEKKYRTEYDDINEGYWPSLELLEELGFEFVEQDPPYIVRRNGRLFYEGGACSELIKQSLSDKSGVYIVNIRRTNKYKIGITKNISRRLKEFRTGNPYIIDLCYFLLTNHPNRVEREFHNFLSSSRIGGEWFEIAELREILFAIEAIKQKYELRIVNALKLIGR